MKEPSVETKTHYAKAKCKSCSEEIVSEGGGRFSQCSCGKSFIDQERWSGAYIRLGGDAELLEAKCPTNCEHPEHKKEKFRSVL